MPPSAVFIAEDKIKTCFFFLDISPNRRHSDWTATREKYPLNILNCLIYCQIKSAQHKLDRQEKF